MLSGVQKHVNCFDRRIKCFLWDIFRMRRTTVCIHLM